ncbi:MAG: NAD(+) diphosphatase [Rhodobacteraceae bacterium]|nr:NAD(+) diphosphatase [Paracoccaceae bacterium]
MVSKILFGNSRIERAAHLRNDAKDQATMLIKESTRFMALWRGNVLVTKTPEIAWLTREEAKKAGPRGDPLFLGIEDGQPRYSIEISDWGEAKNSDRSFEPSEVVHPALPGSVFRDIRSLMHTLPDADLGDAGTAKSLLHWHNSHRYCGFCGSKTTLTHAGWHRLCQKCNRMGFPHIEPVVIMLVTCANQTLLGRSHGWPAGMFSLLAGFMEPGETIAEAVRREVMEETGINIGKVKVLDDQPWPFPGSLMIGCHAEALSQSINLDPVELESALWVSRERVLETLDGADPDFWPARTGSIARNLLDRWLENSI